MGHIGSEGCSSVCSHVTSQCEVTYSTLHKRSCKLQNPIQQRMNRRRRGEEKSRQVLKTASWENSYFGLLPQCNRHASYLYVIVNILNPTPTPIPTSPPKAACKCYQHWLLSSHLRKLRAKSTFDRNNNSTAFTHPHNTLPRKHQQLFFSPTSPSLRYVVRVHFHYYTNRVERPSLIQPNKMQNKPIVARAGKEYASEQQVKKNTTHTHTHTHTHTKKKKNCVVNWLTF